MAGERLDMPRQRVVRLVAVHVDAQAALGGQFAEDAHRFGAVGHRPLEVRDATDHLDAQVQRALEVVQRAGAAQQAVLREGDQLQVQPGFDLLLHVQQRLHRQQARIADIDVAADRQQALGHRPVAVLQGALDQRLLGQLRLQLAPQGDAFEQGAGGIHPRQAVGQGGVHVEVGVDEGRADQLAGGVQLLGGAGGQRGLQGDDAAGADGNVEAAAAVGQGAVADDEIEHGGFLAVGAPGVERSSRALQGLATIAMGAAHPRAFTPAGSALCSAVNRQPAA
ncbi:hypothetical protein D9M71_413250 [compost metagenome]